MGAGHAVTAACAAHFHAGVDGGFYGFDEGKVLFREFPGPGLAGGTEVFLYHFQGIHAGKHAGDLRLVPQPAEAPFRWGAVAGIGGKGLHGIGRQMIDQPAAPQGFHDDHGQALLRRVFQACHPGLGVLVQVVILDLAEIPVVGVDEMAEHVRIAVIGKARPPDFSAGLF